MDVGYAMYGLSLGGELFLIGLDIAGSLDQVDIQINSKQDHTKKSKSTKPTLG